VNSKKKMITRQYSQLACPSGNTTKKDDVKRDRRRATGHAEILQQTRKDGKDFKKGMREGPVPPTWKRQSDSKKWVSPPHNALGTISTKGGRPQWGLTLMTGRIFQA